MLGPSWADFANNFYHARVEHDSDVLRWRVVAGLELSVFAPLDSCTGLTTFAGNIGRRVLLTLEPLWLDIYSCNIEPGRNFRMV